MLKIKETFVNESKGYRYGETDYYEPHTDEKGELFRSLREEYGRCISKVYIDLPDGSAKPVGWCFEKRREYSDCNETYLQHVWVECLEVNEGGD